MLLDFSIGNFRSFFDIQTLDFRATALVSEEKEIDQNNIVEKGGQKVLKTVGLYGPNGSGKTNLIQGLSLFRYLLQSSLESEDAMAFVADPFKLSADGPGHKGFFQVQILIEEKKYRYGFTLGDNAVQEEWLFGPAEKNETWYFKRADGKVESNKEWFDEGHSRPIENLRANTLFLTFVSAYNGRISQAIRGYIVNNISFESPGLTSANVNRTALKMSFQSRLAIRSTQRQPTNVLLKEGKRALVLEWLKRAGLFYTDINVDDGGQGFDNVIVEKAILDKNGNISGKASLDLDLDESAGTKKFYYYIGRLVNLFAEGGLLISDEIDNNFHPSLLRQFVRFFNDPSINSAGAQLLFTSHDTNLLDPEILRRDQIYFAEKSVKDETILYALSDLKGIRNNADFARQYLAGFYGALPMLEKYKELSTDPEL
jgi:AAA15 family ATPase/GTPase